jgi:hypothetical protein
MKWLSTLCLLIVACGSVNISPDPSSSATSAHYPTAEFSACNRLFHGLGVCSLHEHAPFSFQVQTYYNGVVSWTFDKNLTVQSKVYRDSEKVTIEVPQGASIVSFLVTPEIKESTEPVHSLQGYLYLRKQVRPTFVSTLKAPENTDVRLNVTTQSKDGVYDSIISGCGVDRLEKIEVKNKVASFPIKLPSVGIPCIVNGGIKGEMNEEFAFIVAHYAKDFIPLPIPSVKIDRNDIHIAADKTVAMLVVDNRYKISSQAEFDFREDREHIVRAFTVKGRSVIGKYTPGAGFTWLQ